MTKVFFFFLSFSSLSISFYCCLATLVCVEKSVVKHAAIFLSWWFVFLSFLSGLVLFCLSLSFSTLIMICLVGYLFVFILFEIPYAVLFIFHQIWEAFGHYVCKYFSSLFSLTNPSLYPLAAGVLISQLNLWKQPFLSNEPRAGDWEYT